MTARMYDLAIIGGGINGVGIARDAAGRGLKVLLVERDDLASHTSSASTKLVHGGLRYLEHYEFNLVRKALKEREVLLRAAPHIIWPMRFVLPVDDGMRPAWLLRLGLFLYDHLGGRDILPGTKSLNLLKDHRGDPLQKRLKKGFAYSDCWVEDARLVSLTARDAANRGADIRTRAECIGLDRTSDHWSLTIQRHGETVTERAKILVNAAGPWVDPVTAMYDRSSNAAKLRLVKGSHIVVKRKYEGDHSYIFQNSDGRIIFAIPYEGEHTLIGTTDEPWSYAEGEAKISAGEIAYLCEAASEYFEVQVTPDDIQWTYSGVRPLFDDHSRSAATVTRDFVFDYDNEKGAPVLSIFGGKITTYRVLALQAIRTLSDALDVDGDDWTKKAHLPGGDFPPDGFEALVDHYADTWSFLDKSVMHRLVRAYGTDTATMLKPVKSLADMGQDFGAGLYEIELRWLIDQEFARTAEDVLWRRSKLGLHMSDAGQQAVALWFAQQDQNAKRNLALS
ncbi:MAG: glycerol-3-phosphate dehydrogenase [Sphingomonadales bacterium]|nr:glycerol-3-phosphate dehydrogenase [Sphingomonadales bacterium]PIX66202.1 MAG: glycerol-3-phosphate dehydrogenase [Sphingomonadales bacterium CG_4_10_14_3_um_filter_58_15]NCO49228.1 glycerol-3-phosphate dehydrogenase [Sphingomonadales bacterium]NCP00148.1 glycerol-3-phosphate dehydrogenase [Sphingomonadales bacterium]NCP25772.1 glycerol-3-phosphate dehydrogenase [Sphingomonadales bacterium]